MLGEFYSTLNLSSFGTSAPSVRNHIRNRQGPILTVSPYHQHPPTRDNRSRVGLLSFPDGSGTDFPQDLTQHPQPLVSQPHHPTTVVKGPSVDEPTDDLTPVVKEVYPVRSYDLHPTNDLP